MKKSLNRLLVWILLRFCDEQPVTTSSQCSSGFVFGKYSEPSWVVACVKTQMSALKSAGCGRCAVFCGGGLFNLMREELGLDNFSDGSSDYLVMDHCLKPYAIKIEWRYKNT